MKCKDTIFDLQKEGFLNKSSEIIPTLGLRPRNLIQNIMQTAVISILKTRIS